MAQDPDPWVVDDVWSDDYLEDLEELDRVARGLGVAFIIVAGVVLSLVLALFLLADPSDLFRLLFSAGGDE